MDKGPWRPYFKVKDHSCTVGVESDDSSHDVLLTIHGDFRNLGQCLKYATWLCSVLNGHSTPEQDRSGLKE